MGKEVHNHAGGAIIFHKGKPIGPGRSFHSDDPLMEGRVQRATIGGPPKNVDELVLERSDDLVDGNDASPPEEIKVADERSDEDIIAEEFAKEEAPSEPTVDEKTPDPVKEELSDEDLEALTAPSVTKEEGK